MLEKIAADMPMLLVLSVFLTSFGIGVCIVVLHRWFPNFVSRPSDLTAVQSMHSKPTSRLGGLGIIGAFAVIVVSNGYTGGTLFGGFTLGIVVLFAVGLAEDLGVHVTPVLRLIAAVISSLLIMYQVGFWLEQANLPVVNFLLSYAVLGIPLTVFITVGITNGFNLIDGVNGLAGLAGIAGASSLAFIAHSVGLESVAQASLLLGVGIAGFSVLNFPFGLIFLGDAGAYVIGMTLSWLGVIILVNGEGVASWAILLALFWPLADTTLAIWRRSGRKASAMQPDRLHVHQLVMRALNIYFFAKKKHALSNPLTTVVLAPYVITPPICAALSWDKQLVTFGLTLLFSLLFFLAYIKLLAYVKSRSRRPAGTNV